MCLWFGFYFCVTVETEITAGVPVLLCSVPGFDASSRVDDLAAEKSKQIASIAIGSAEGFNQADNVINVAVRSGRSVVIRNIYFSYIGCSARTFPNSLF